MQSSKVHLLSTDHQDGLSNSWQIPFDPSLKEVTVALSGPAPNIEIRNSLGKESIFVLYLMCDISFSRHNTLHYKILFLKSKF